MKIQYNDPVKEQPVHELLNFTYFRLNNSTNLYLKLNRHLGGNIVNVLNIQTNTETGLNSNTIVKIIPINCITITIDLP